MKEKRNNIKSKEMRATTRLIDMPVIKKDKGNE